MKPYYDLPVLSAGEESLPLAKYFHNYPLYRMPPLQQQILDAGPMDPREALSVCNMTDILKPEGYDNVKFGYCMLPDGAGCYAEYTVIPTIPGSIKGWYMKWINHRSRNMPKGQGNLRYKLWCPVDHWDRAPVDGVDPANGVYTIGTLDLGASGNPNSGIMEVNHKCDLSALGFTEEAEAKLKAAGCKWSASWEDFNRPGHHIWVHLERPLSGNRTEMIAWEWLGYWQSNGTIVRDETTEVNEEMLKSILVHNVVEHLHLPEFLPDLYTEYRDKPIDAD